MTERMEPTNRLRWVRRRIGYWPVGLGGEPIVVNVLQQLWQRRRAELTMHYGYEQIVAEEWRDVPVEDA